MSMYQHTQPGTLMRFTFGVSIFVCLVLAAAFGSRDPDALWALLAVSLTLVLALALFHSLTVRVGASRIELRFGIGLIRKSFDLALVQEARAVRNHWYNGWGIRAIRGGWLYNVSGLDAVEVTFSNGKLCRIGTDEPRRLLRAIELAGGIGRA